MFNDERRDAWLAREWPGVPPFWANLRSLRTDILLLREIEVAEIEPEWACLPQVRPSFGPTWVTALDNHNGADCFRV